VHSNAILCWASALILAALVFPCSCRAQYPADFHPYTFDASAGWTSIHGADRQSFSAFPIFQLGAGVAWNREKPREYYPDAIHPDFRHFNVLVTGQVLFGNSDLKGQPASLFTTNPQNPTLLSATGGKGKFYAATAGPRFQYSGRWLSVYAQPSAGWLRRSIDLTGPSTEGGALQPNSPAVFHQAGSSGVVRVTGGLSVSVTKGLRLFGEIGLLQGLAINHGTMLAPILSGGARW
jgi:hypothetical protein